MSDQWSSSGPSTTTPGAAGPTGQSSTTQAAKDEAGNVASTARDSGGQVAGTAKDEGQRVLSEATDQARNLVDETRTQVQQQAGAQQERAAGTLRSLGDELESMADSSEQSGLGTQLVRQASERAKGAASWLDNRDPQALLHEVRSLARRRPGAFLLGAAVAGMVAGRMTRAGVDVARDQHSSSDSDFDQYRTTDPTGYDTGMTGYPTGVEPGSPGYAGTAGAVVGAPPVASPSTGVPAGEPRVNPYPGAQRTGDDLVDPEGPRR